MSAYLCKKYPEPDRGGLTLFYRDVIKRMEVELVQEVNKAVLALMLAANPDNLLKANPVKSCAEYFLDFQYFLRMALSSYYYHRLITYPPGKANVIETSLIEIIQSICGALYTHLQGTQSMFAILEGMVHQARNLKAKNLKEITDMNLSEHLAFDYSQINRLMKRHPNGPMNKALEFLESNSGHFFNPLLQRNIPNQWFEMNVGEKSFDCIRFASPTEQDFVHQAQVNEEFKGWMRGYYFNGAHKKHLLINLQDKTSWREHARAKALEELANNPDFSRNLVVVTLTMDSEFYHQVTDYQYMNHAEAFMKQFKEHLLGEGYGYYIPAWVAEVVGEEFFDGAMHAIHRVFFNGRNVLSREARMDFIEIFYSFFVLKLIDALEPNSFSLTCKDGVDAGGAEVGQIYALIKLLNDEKVSEVELEYLNFILFMPAMMVRERGMLQDRFDRMLRMIKAIEGARNAHGFEAFKELVRKEFGPLYRKPMLSSKIFVPRAKE